MLRYCMHIRITMSQRNIADGNSDVAFHYADQIWLQRENRRHVNVFNHSVDFTSMETIDFPSPSFPESQQHSHSSAEFESHHLSSAKATISTSDSLQRHHTPIPVRTLHFRCLDNPGRHINAFTTTESQPIYQIDCKTFKPQLTFRTGPSLNKKIGVVNFHTMASKIDTTVRDKSMCMKSTGGFWKDKYAVASAARPGVQLTWSCQRASSELLCVDQNYMPLARFYFGGFSLSKVGRMDFLAPEAANGQALEEVMVTGMAFVCLIVQILRTSTVMKFGAVSM